ncbi:TPA: hypothetical protein ACQYFB_001962, partial [Vibrio parahaemolyticus]
MKVLLYVEPHPIRNELTHHKAILLSKWGRKLESWNATLDKSGNNVEVRMACHHFSYNLVQSQTPNTLPYVIPTNYAEETKIQENLISWSSAGLDKWSMLMRGEEDSSFHVYRDFLHRIKKEVFDFDAVIFWGLNGYASNVVKSLGATPYFMELSSIRNPFPPSVYIDADGVNGFASPASLELEYIIEKAKQLESPEALTSPRSGCPLSEPEIFDRKFYFSESNFVFSNDDNTKKVLVPLQIGDDSNVILGSDYNATFDYVKDVCDRLSGKDVTLYFKPHPGARGRGGIVLKDHFKAQQYVESMPNAHWLEDAVSNQDYMSFLRQFDAIITINSSLGFEGMILGVPVFPMGEAIYKPRGYNYNINDIVELLNNDREEMISIGYSISRFIMNTVFMSELKLVDSFSPILDKVELFEKSNSNEEYYESLLGFDR